MPINKEKVRKALRHKDVPGAGAKARRKHRLNAEENAAALAKEFKRGTLRSGSGAVVRKRDQLRAITASETRRIKGKKRGK
jgi:hypothetical protein